MHYYLLPQQIHTYKIRGGWNLDTYVNEYLFWFELYSIYYTFVKLEYIFFDVPRRILVVSFLIMEQSLKKQK